jgi:hypothetical protein
MLIRPRKLQLRLFFYGFIVLWVCIHLLSVSTLQIHQHSNASVSILPNPHRFGPAISGNSELLVTSFTDTLESEAFTCGFKLACVDSDSVHILLSPSYLKERNLRIADFYDCEKRICDGRLDYSCRVEEFPEKICRCKSPKIKLKFSGIDVVVPSRIHSEPAWMMNHWSYEKHIDHWFMKMAETSIMFMQNYSVDVSLVVYQDYPADHFTPMEQFVWDVFQAAVNNFSRPREFSKLLIAHGSKFECFDHLRYRPYYQLDHLQKKSIQKYRNVLNSVLVAQGANVLQRSSCPPQTAAILIRTEGNGLRLILNLEEVKSLISEVFPGITILELKPNSKTDYIEQAKMFNSFGLLLASHSSQLFNLVFTPESAVVIELNSLGTIDPYPDFEVRSARYGITHLKSYGHLTAQGVHGEKESDFVAQLDLLRPYLVEAKRLLDLRCGGRFLSKGNHNI